jgi:lipoprotein
MTNNCLKKSVFMAVLVGGLLASSCSRKQPAAGNRTETGELPVAAAGTSLYSSDVRTLNIEEGIEKLLKVTGSYVSWQQIKVPVSVKLASPKKFSVSGTAELVCGKSVMFSFKFLGMEVAWLYLSQDNITVVDKMNKRYISDSPAKLLSGFAVTATNLQDILIGHPFVLGTERFTEESMKSMVYAECSTGGWSVQPESSLKGLEYGFWFEPAEILNAVVVQFDGKSPVAVLYGDSQTTSAGPMASSLTVKAQLGDKPLDLTLYWNWDKAKWGDTFTPRQPIVPVNYTKVESKGILKIFEQ